MGMEIVVLLEFQHPFSVILKDTTVYPQPPSTRAAASAAAATVANATSILRAQREPVIIWMPDRLAVYLPVSRILENSRETGLSVPISIAGLKLRPRALRILDSLTVAGIGPPAQVVGRFPSAV